MFGWKCAPVFLRWQCDQLVIQFVATAHGFSVPPISAVRIQRVGEYVMAFVGMRIGPFWRAQQRETQHVALHIVSILAVVKQTEAVFRIRKISPTLRRDFEFGLFGGSVPSRRTFDRAIGN